MKMLVIGSCTGDKNVRDCPGLLTQSDLDDSSLFQRGGLESPTLSASFLSTSYEQRYLIPRSGAFEMPQT
jgi:hypothetical protein